MRRIITAIIFIMVTTQVNAHKFLNQILTQQNASSDTIFTPISNHQLTHKNIIVINQQGTPIDYFLEPSKGLVGKPRPPSSSCDVSGSKTCGQFDHFTRARNAAIKTCYQLEALTPNAYPSSLVPLYLGPSSFVDGNAASDAHHLNYHLIEGLSFNCGYTSFVGRK